MTRDRRFGEPIAAPARAEIVQELKRMALCRSLDAAVGREAAEMLPGDVDTAVRDAAARPPITA